MSKQKLIVLQGLPGSGKSTFAKDLLAKNPKLKRLNNDLLVEMLDLGRNFSPKNWKLIDLTRRNLLMDLLDSGYDVLIDNTNLAPKHITYYQDTASQYNAEFILYDHFLKVPLEECIKNDLKRLNSVGKDVILEMYYRYIVPISHDISHFDNSLEDCIIVDLDGTLAHHSGKGRGHYEWDKVDEDTVDYNINTIIQLYRDNGIKIILLTGRDLIAKDKTLQWLDKHWIKYDELFFPRTPDKVDENGKKIQDDILKKECYLNEIKPKYNVLFALDDRPRVIRMWESLGIKVLNVGQGYEF